MIGPVAAWALALAITQPDSEPQHRSVMFVEMGRHVGNGGPYHPPDIQPDEIPWSYYLIAQVRPFQSLAGRRYSGPIRLEYATGAARIPGSVMLVIAEPSRRGRGLFARWYTFSQDDRGRYCVPESVVEELEMRGAFRHATRVDADNLTMFCVRSPIVARD